MYSDHGKSMTFAGGFGSGHDRGKPYGITTESKEERQDRLDSEWSELLPCNTCAISDICKYNKAVKRIDYPHDIFDISVNCKITEQYGKKNCVGGFTDSEEQHG